MKKSVTPYAKTTPFLSKGVRYMLLATLGFAVMQSIIKSLSTFHVFEIIFFRSAITGMLSVGYLRNKKIPLRGNSQKWLVLRAFFGVISMCAFFITLQRMPIGASVSLKYLAPIFTTIFAVLFLKEKIRALQWILFGFALVGVLLLKGVDVRIDTISLILGLVGATCGGLVYTIIRKIGSSEHSMVIISYFMLSAAALSSIAMIPYWITPTIGEWMLLFAVGISGYFAQVFMTKSLQVELASKVAPVKYTEVVYCIVIGLIWFDEGYTNYAILGIVLIITSMLINVKLSKATQEMAKQ